MVFCAGSARGRDGAPPGGEQSTTPGADVRRGHQTAAPDHQSQERAVSPAAQPLR